MECLMDTIECFVSTDEKVFLAREKQPIFARLPPGVYNFGNGMRGFWFERQNLATSKISVLDDDQAALLKEAKTFWGAAEKYREFGFAHKRGILLYGPPGTGKTTSVRSLIDAHTRDDGIVLRIRNDDDCTLFAMAYWIIRQANPDMRLLAVMEDIENLVSNCEEQLLDLLDGLQATENLMFLATTNHLVRLPLRLRARPGRFDRVLPIGYPCAATRAAFVRSFAPDMAPNLLDEVVEVSAGLSLAHIKEIVLRKTVYTGCDGDALEIMRKQCDFPLEGFADEMQERIHASTNVPKPSSIPLEELMCVAAAKGT